MNVQQKLAIDFCDGNYDHDLDDHVWPSVFEYLVEHSASLSPNKPEIRKRWIVSGGHLRRKVQNDELVLAVLRLYLPGYDGDGLTLYRGECRHLYESAQIGFCWTPKRDIAEMFASGLNAMETGGGVLLQGYAPPEAILAGPSDYSWTAQNEAEHTCDPTLIKDIEVIDEYPWSP